VPRRPLETRKERRIEFIGEQDDPSERDLKAALSTVFLGDPSVDRAYLAIVGFHPADQRSVALCLVSSRPGDQTLLKGVGAIFHRLFSSDMHLDVLFLSPQQEEDARRVCRAFYPAPPNEELKPTATPSSLVE
jgi:hypothetical protein